MKELTYKLLDYMNGDYRRIIIVVIVGIVLYFVAHALLDRTPMTLLDKGYLNQSRVISSHGISSLLGLGLAFVAVMILCIGFVNFSFRTYDVTCESISDFKQTTRQNTIEQMGGEENVKEMRESLELVMAHKDDLGTYVMSVNSQTYRNNDLQ